MFRKGILSTTTTVIPFNRIQHVALHEGVFSRMYQLSELQVYTAGGSSSDLHIPGLPREEAERIKTFLLNNISVLEKESIEMNSKVEETSSEDIQFEHQSTTLPESDTGNETKN